MNPLRTSDRILATFQPEILGSENLPTRNLEGALVHAPKTALAVTIAGLEGFAGAQSGAEPSAPNVTSEDATRPATVSPFRWRPEPTRKAAAKEAADEWAAVVRDGISQLNGTGLAWNPVLQDGDTNITSVLQQLAELEGGQNLLLAPNTGLSQGLVTLIPSENWSEFANFYEEATGAAADPESAVHTLLVPDPSGGPARVLFAIPTEAAHVRPKEILYALRVAIGFRETDYTQVADPSHVLPNVKETLDRLSSQDTSEGPDAKLAKLQDAFEQLLTTRLDRADVQATLSDVIAKLQTHRAQTVKSATRMPWFSELMQGAADPSTKQHLYEVDDHMLCAKVERAYRRQMVRAFVNNASQEMSQEGLPAWFIGLRDEWMPKMMSQVFETFPAINEFRITKSMNYPSEYKPDGVYLGPEALGPAFDYLRTRCTDGTAFVAFQKDLMNRVFHEMRNSNRPEDRHALERRSFSRGAFERVCRAIAEGNAWPLKRERPDDEWQGLEAFGQIFNQGGVPHDPYFTLQEDFGPHGEWLHLMQKAFLVHGANDEQRAQIESLFKFFGQNGEHLGTGGMAALIAFLDASPSREHEHALIPRRLIPLLEMFTGAF